MEDKDYEKIYEEYKQQSELEAQVEASQNNPEGKDAFVAVRKNDDFPNFSWQREWHNVAALFSFV
jgi:hypothetical protein